MTHQKDRIQTPLSKAKGLGAAHEGTTHWFHQRLTAVALIPLVLWFVWSIVGLSDATYVEFIVWMSKPFNAVASIALILTAFYHAALGCQVIVEDYFHHEGLKLAKLIGIKVFFAFGALICVFSILKIAFTAGF